jgi:hypothetical protein
MRKEEKHMTIRAMNMNVEVLRGRYRPKIRWIACVRMDMREMDMCDKVTNDRGGWKKKPYCSDPIRNKGRKKK